MLQHAKMVANLFVLFLEITHEKGNATSGFLPPSQATRKNFSLKEGRKTATPLVHPKAHSLLLIAFATLLRGDRVEAARWLGEVVARRTMRW